MSSHREAPEVSKDPVADSTDLYAFVSPDKPRTVTLIANYVPLESPDGGPNFYEFGDDVLYEINIDNNGDGLADIVYQFQFHTEITNPNTFLYNTAPILSLTDSSWNRRQSYTVSRVDKGGFPQVLGFGPPVPALQHRAPLDPRLPVVGPGGDQDTGHDDRVRRPAGRGLLRGPRGHLRPRDPPTVRRGPHHLQI